MVTAYVGFMTLPYFENMHYYGTPTPNFTKIAHDLFMKKTNPAQKKIFLQQEVSQNKTITTKRRWKELDNNKQSSLTAAETAILNTKMIQQKDTIHSSL